MGPLIDIRGLTKYFGKKKVLDGLDLSIDRGETFVIIGRSGCGKSVLLKHIIGLLRPDEGSIVVDGQDLTRVSHDQLRGLRLRFGMLFQGAALFDSLNVGENVSFGWIEQGSKKKEEIDGIVRVKLSMVGLEGIEELMPSELSGGMKKRVGLARAVAMDPEFMLYDEPTTGVDPIMADVINELIIELHGKLAVTSVAVTHDMRSAYKIADRIGMLYEGKIIFVGTPNEIKGSDNPYVRQFITGNAVGPITGHI